MSISPIKPNRQARLGQELARLAAARLTRLRVLAATEPPVHDCHLRQEILRARTEFARLDATTPKIEQVQAPTIQQQKTYCKPTESAKAPELFGKTDRACDFLANILKDGPLAASETLAAAEGANISTRTIQRATERLGLVKTKISNGQGWSWALPQEELA